jgi:hypothetical protein
MLGTVAIWLALASNNRGLATLGAVLLAVALATIVWNVIP